jgi:catechol 2,3-dioxygenase-like lactoylglutathione lyase family enzyme
MSSRPTPALRVDHVSIMVGSLAASMPYYDALLPLLGYSKRRDHVYSDDSGFSFQFHEAAPDTRPYERHGAGLNHLGFFAPDEPFVHAVRDAMRARGFAVPEIQHLGGAVALFMKDPDGLRFEVTAYPPGAENVD